MGRPKQGIVLEYSNLKKELWKIQQAIIHREYAKAGRIVYKLRIDLIEEERAIKRQAKTMLELTY